MKLRCRGTVAAIGDERSMLQSAVLGAFERNVAKTAHGGGHNAEFFGGVPIVILIGDDGQLPPTKQPGAFHALSTGRWSQKMGCKLRGDMLFHTLSETVVALTKLKRQDESDREHVELLDDIRSDTVTNDQNCNLLESLHLDNFASEEQRFVHDSKDTMHLFGTNAPMNEHNLDRLCKESSADNPVAFIRSKASSMFWHDCMCRCSLVALDACPQCCFQMLE